MVSGFQFSSHLSPDSQPLNRENTVHNNWPRALPLVVAMSSFSALVQAQTLSFNLPPASLATTLNRIARAATSLPWNRRWCAASRPQPWSAR
jgi:hypothetical protein